MNRGEILTEWEKCKEELKFEIEAFNRKTGRYDLEGIVTRQIALKEYAAFIPNIGEYLAVGDFIEWIRGLPFVEAIDELAFEKGWTKCMSEPHWKDDKHKLISVASYSRRMRDDLSELIPFDYYHQSGDERTIYRTSAGCSIVILKFNQEEKQYKAAFNEDFWIRENLIRIYNGPQGIP